MTDAHISNELSLSVNLSDGGQGWKPKKIVAQISTNFLSGLEFIALFSWALSEVSVK